MDTPALFGRTQAELTELFASMGQRPFRARQVWDALYKQRVRSIEDITTLAQGFRDDLMQQGFTIGLPEIVQTARSVDGTERYLMRMADGETVETVWMPDGDGGERGDGSEAAEEESAETVSAQDALLPASEQGGVPAEARGYWDRRTNGRPKSAFGTLAEQGFRRATICISSQVGCAVNCQFCLTAKLGIERNLTPGEIAGQVVSVLRRHRAEPGRDRINLVFMGMGEPFLNYDAFMDAFRLLVNEVGLAPSRMTVSTSGIVPGIERFAAEPLRPRLALSLNGSNNVVREAVMPITRKWPIEQLLEAARAVPLGPREKITFEYVLLGGVNDGVRNADEVAVLARRAGFPVKVNLIVWNPGPGIPYRQPADEDVQRFQQRLIERGVPAFIRRPRGRDIYAACGQLKKTIEAAS